MLSIVARSKLKSGLCYVAAGKPARNDAAVSPVDSGLKNCSNSLKQFANIGLVNGQMRCASLTCGIYQRSQLTTSGSLTTATWLRLVSTHMFSIATVCSYIVSVYMARVFARRSVVSHATCCCDDIVDSEIVVDSHDNTTTLSNGRHDRRVLGRRITDQAPVRSQCFGATVAALWY